MQLASHQVPKAWGYPGVAPPVGRPARASLPVTTVSATRTGGAGAGGGVTPSPATPPPSSLPPLRPKTEVKQVLMVDPIVAKRMAAQDMEARLQAQRMQRQRDIEAANGGWAVLGLTAGLIAEGRSGQGILEQIAGYLDSVTELLGGAAS